MITLKQMTAARRAAREQERERVLRCLRECLRQALPAGAVVWIYGSLAKPFRFHENSDVDLAIEMNLDDSALAALVNKLSSSTGRSVDLCLLDSTRLEEVIRGEGTKWTV